MLNQREISNRPSVPRGDVSLSRANYVYESSQQSILRPLYRRFLWNRILDVLPNSLSPNAMTLISTFCCAVSFGLSATLRHNPLALSTAAVLVLAYVTLDNLDGAHARRLGRGTRLGEFLDHWLDTLNNGFIVLGGCMAAGLPPLLTLGVLCFGTLAFFSVQWELRQTGVFRTGRVADIEGNTTVALLYVVLAVFGADVLVATFIAGVSLAVWMSVGVIAQALWTFFSAVRRVTESRADFLPVLFTHLALILWAATGGLSPLAYLAVAFFLNPVFTARPVVGRLLGKTTPRLDWVVVGALAATAGFAAFGALPIAQDAAAYAVATVLAAITLRHFASTVAALRGEPVLVDTTLEPLPPVDGQPSAELRLAG